MDQEQKPEAVQLKKKKSFVRSLGNFLVYVAIVLGIVFGLPKFLSWSLDTPYPMAAITSGSMWPALKEGDLVFIQGFRKKEDVNVGDIIVYRNSVNNTLTIHRVKEMREDTVVTKGDANFSEDAPASYEDIIGKTLYVFDKPLRLPYLGSITVYANNLRVQDKKK